MLTARKTRGIKLGNMSESALAKTAVAKIQAVAPPPEPKKKKVASANASASNLPKKRGAAAVSKKNVTN